MSALEPKPVGRDRRSHSRISGLMACRCRLLIAALGIALLPIWGQAQEESPPGDESAADRQEVAEPLPIPLPIRIIEDDERARTRERNEAEARQRDIDALAAQEGMNRATQAMNEATQRMAGYSLWSTVASWGATIAVWIGTPILIWNLHLMRKANQTARDGVEVTREIGMTQTRAYLSITEVLYTNRHEGFAGDQFPTFHISCENVGLSPARDIVVAVFGRIEIRDDERREHEHSIAATAVLPDIGQGGKAHRCQTTVAMPDVPNFFYHPNATWVDVDILVTATDVFGERIEARSSFYNHSLGGGQSELALRGVLSPERLTALRALVRELKNRNGSA